MTSHECEFLTRVKNALYSHSDIRHLHREWPQQLCCTHGFSHHESLYVTCLRLTSTI